MVAQVGGVFAQRFTVVHCVPSSQLLQSSHDEHGASHGVFSYAPPQSGEDFATWVGMTFGCTTEAGSPGGKNGRKGGCERQRTWGTSM